MSNRKIFIISIIALLILVAVFYSFYESTQPAYNWDDSWDRAAYSEASAEPYGAQIFHQILDGYFPGHKVHNITDDVGKSLPADSAAKSSYVFIGPGLFLDSLSTVALLSYVAAGNTALISSKSIPFDLMNSIYFEECEDAIWNDYAEIMDTFVYLSLTEPKLNEPARFFFAFQNQPRPHGWNYIDNWFFCDELAQRPLGYMNEKRVNFAEFPYGEGRFLLHCSPLALSNFSLVHPETHAYAEGILSRLPVGDIYWDAVSKIPEAASRKRNNSSRHLDEEHLLTYILKQPALAWAWYIVIGLALLWLIFRAKRRQRVIPVLPSNENTSYEFIKTIANLHFRERNYKGMCLQGMKIFLTHIRERYGVTIPFDNDTNLPRIDNALIQRLVAMSQVSEPLIREVFAKYSNTVTYEPTEDMMVEFHLAMEAFFKKAK